jgi:hypothetical protein
MGTATLFWDPSAPARKKPKEFRATYASFEEAKSQADHDARHGIRVLRIEDATGKVLWEKKA